MMSFEEAAEMLRGLPQRTRLNTSRTAVDQYLIENPETEEIGSSDTFIITVEALRSMSEAELREVQETAKLENKLLATPGFDWDAAARMFEPVQ